MENGDAFYAADKHRLAGPCLCRLVDTAQLLD